MIEVVGARGDLAAPTLQQELRPGVEDEPVGELQRSDADVSDDVSRCIGVAIAGAAEAHDRGMLRYGERNLDIEIVEVALR